MARRNSNDEPTMTMAAVAEDTRVTRCGRKSARRRRLGLRGRRRFSGRWDARPWSCGAVPCPLKAPLCLPQLGQPPQMTRYPTVRTQSAQWHQCERVGREALT